MPHISCCCVVWNSVQCHSLSFSFLRACRCFSAWHDESNFTCICRLCAHASFTRLIYCFKRFPSRGCAICILLLRSPKSVWCYSLRSTFVRVCRCFPTWHDECNLTCICRLSAHTFFILLIYCLLSPVAVPYVSCCSIVITRIWTAWERRRWVSATRSCRISQKNKLELATFCSMLKTVLL